MNREKDRNSSYELMRIVSMFLIVLYHIILHGKVLENCQNEGLKIIFEFIEFVTLVHVNSFILVTGYYQVESNFKQSKIWSLLNANWFYRVLIVILLLTFNIVSIDKVSLIKEIFPINLNEYWFFKNYLLLYCLTPFINKGIEKLNKSTYQKMIIVSFIIFSIVPSVTGGSYFDNSGFTLYQFVFLYMVGAYLKKYPLSKSYIFKVMSKNMYKLILIFILFTCVFSNYILYKYSMSVSSVNTVLGEISSYVSRASTLYNNPFVIIQSICFFEYFGTLTIKNRYINKLASLVFGIYLIHDNNFSRGLIYAYLKINDGPIYSYKFIFYVFFIAVLIYAICAVIEYIRQKLFKKIYNFKLSKMIREKYYEFIKNVKFINSND